MLPTWRSRAGRTTSAGRMTKRSTAPCWTSSDTDVYWHRPKGDSSMSHHYTGPDFAFPRGDARVDLTDLYVFPKPGDRGKSIVIMDVHPSFGFNPPGPTTTEPFAPEALYELRVDTNGAFVADIAYRLRFSLSDSGLTATLRRVSGPDPARVGSGGGVRRQ